MKTGKETIDKMNQANPKHPEYSGKTGEIIPGLDEAIRHGAYNAIANFIGRKLTKRPGVDQQWEFSFCDGYFPTLSTMKFKTSWDWLMPVVDRINSLKVEGERIDVIIYRNTCHINDPQQILIETTGVSMIDAVYKAVLEFIDWYQKHNK